MMCVPQLTSRTWVLEILKTHPSHCSTSEPQRFRRKHPGSFSGTEPGGWLLSDIFYAVPQASNSNSKPDSASLNPPTSISFAKQQL